VLLVGGGAALGVLAVWWRAIPDLVTGALGGGAIALLLCALGTSVLAWSRKKRPSLADRLEALDEALTRRLVELAGSAATVAPVLSRLDEAQQAAAREAREHSFEMKAALEGLPASVSAVDGRLIEMAKQAAEQSGAIRQEVQAALTSMAGRMAVQPAPPAANVEHPHALDVTARMRALSGDSWTYQTYSSQNRTHAALIGRRFITLEVTNIGKRTIARGRDPLSHRARRTILRGLVGRVGFGLQG